MKGCLKRIGALLLTIVLSVCVLTSCYWYMEKYDLDLVSKATVTEWSFDEETDMYTVFVEGLAQNNRGETLEDVVAYVDFYDELGDPIYTASSSTSIDYMEAGEIWHYAMLIETKTIPTEWTVSVYAYIYD